MRRYRSRKHIFDELLWLSWRVSVFMFWYFMIFALKSMFIFARGFQKQGWADKRWIYLQGISFYRAPSPPSLPTADSCSRACSWIAHTRAPPEHHAPGFTPNSRLLNRIPTPKRFLPSKASDKASINSSFRRKFFHVFHWSLGRPKRIPLGQPDFPILTSWLLPPMRYVQVSVVVSFVI